MEIRGKSSIHYERIEELRLVISPENDCYYLMNVFDASTAFTGIEERSIRLAPSSTYPANIPLIFIIAAVVIIVGIIQFIQRFIVATISILRVVDMSNVATSLCVVVIVIVVVAYLAPIIVADNRVESC